MNNWEKYLRARNDIKDFYQVVWDESLRKTIKELAEKIKEYDANIYEKLDGKLYEDESAIEDEDHSTLGELMQSLFNHIKPLDEREFVEATGELKEPTESELYDEEKTILLRMMPEFTKIFNIIYGAFISKQILAGSGKPIHGLHDLHYIFEDENARIRYPDNNNNPYWDKRKGLDSNGKVRPNYDWTYRNKEKTFEFLEFNTGVIEHMKSNRDFITHRDDSATSARFEVAERPITDPFTKIEHPENYIMLANLCMSCVYEIIELMQIWVDSMKIASKKQSK